MEGDMECVSFDFSWDWETPSFFYDAQMLDLDLGVVDSLQADCCGMYLPVEDSLSGLYSCYNDFSSPEGANSWSTVTTRPARESRNVILERDRRKKLNEKLYALRGVVPNITKLEVTELGEKLALVSVRHAKTRGAMAAVCRALESLCLKVITASVTTVAGSMIHTMFIETDGMYGAETIKETVQAAIGQLHVRRSPLTTMSY